MLNYKIYGEGKPVVFLHGFLETISMWEVFELEKFPFQSVLIDLPGHGDSKFEVQEVSIIAVAKQVEETLTFLNISNYSLVGHSLGGYVAVELHKLLKSKNKLVFYHSNFWEDSPEKKNDRNRVIQIVQKNKDLFIKEAIPNLFLKEWQNDIQVEKLLNEAIKINKEVIVFYSEAMRDRISNIAYVISEKEQICIIQGENDRLIPNELYKEYSKSLIISIIKKAGHMSYIENLESATEFFKKL